MEGTNKKRYDPGDPSAKEIQFNLMKKLLSVSGLVWLSILIQNTDADQVLLARQRDSIERVKLAVVDLAGLPREIGGNGGYFDKQPGVNDSTCSRTAAVSSGHCLMTACQNPGTQCSLAKCTDLRCTDTACSG